ncbi:MAG: translation initiation factor IF-2 subunit alpha [Candidatus Aenigmatarchaeota archaeon]
MVRKKGLPQWSELVLVTVEKLTPYAAWCKLVEYPGVEGMIHVTEVAGKWVHDIRDFVKINKQYVAKVIKIDYQKNFVNLSLKRVSEKDEKEKMNAFRKEQRAEKLLEQAAKELGKNLDQAYEEVGFLLQEKFGDLFTAFEVAKTSKEELIKNGVSKEWAEAIAKIAEESIQEKEYEIKAEIELKSFDKDGIKKIKELLSSLKEKTGGTVKYISAPKYRIEIKGKDPKSLEKKLIKELEAVCQQIEKFGGEGKIKLLKS